MFAHKTILALSLLVLASVSVAGQAAQAKQDSTTPSANSAEVSSTPAASPAAPLAEQSPVDDRLPFMADSSRDNQDQPPGTGGLMLRTLGALLLIVGLIVAAAWLMKRFGGARFGKVADDAPELSIMNSVALGDKRSLAIVRFGERTLLLGSTAQSITVLAESTGNQSTVTPVSVAEMLNEDKQITFAEELSSAERGGELAQW